MKKCLQKGVIWPQVIRSSGHQVIRSSGHQVIRSSGHQVIRSSGHQGCTERFYRLISFWVGERSARRVMVRETACKWFALQAWRVERLSGRWVERMGGFIKVLG